MTAAPIWPQLVEAACVDQCMRFGFAWEGFEEKYRIARRAEMSAALRAALAKLAEVRPDLAPAIRALLSEAEAGERATSPSGTP